MHLFKLNIIKRFACVSHVVELLQVDSTCLVIDFSVHLQNGFYIVLHLYIYMLKYIVIGGVIIASRIHMF
jgi:hypothetical protein